MVNKNDSLDKSVALPFLRLCPDYKSDTTKFVFEREKTSVETVTSKKEDGTIISVQTQEKIYRKEVKVTLKLYKHSAEENAEHFFEAWEWLRKEMEEEFEQASRAKDKDATILFKAIDKMLDGVANTEWHNVLGNEPNRTWEMFKTKVSLFINDKIMTHNAYDEQVNYLRERPKPMKLTVAQYWSKFQTHNDRLPYMIPTMAKLKAEYPMADFTKWWVWGKLSEADMKMLDESNTHWYCRRR